VRRLKLICDRMDVNKVCAYVLPVLQSGNIYE